MTDQLVIERAEGSISVPATTLARIVVTAAELGDGVRVHRPRRGLGIDVDGSSANVSLAVVAPDRTPLPALAQGVQERVAGALEQMCGLTVEAVDVSIEEVER